MRDIDCEDKERKKEAHATMPRYRIVSAMTMILGFTGTLGFVAMPIGPSFGVPSRSETSLFSSHRSSSSDDIFMASLQSRMEQVQERSSVLPLVVLDAMLPGQVLKIRVNNPVFLELVRSRIADEAPYFGMLGMARVEPPGLPVHLKTGVQVDIVGKPAVVDGDRENQSSLQVTLQASKRFLVVGSAMDSPSGWTEAKVEFLSDSDDLDKGVDPNDPQMLARAIAKARKIQDLVEDWIVLAKQRERQPGQVDQVLRDIGEIPKDTEPTRLALWIGALINPLPPMGVALEIRPALLTARNAEDRAEIALKGIERSIRHMNGIEPLLY